MKSYIFFISVVLSALFVSCSSESIEDGTTPPTIPLTRSEIEIVSAENTFALNMLTELLKESNSDENICISPLCAFFNFSMLTTGANPETQKVALERLTNGNSSLEDLNQLNQKLLSTLVSIDRQTTVMNNSSAWFDNSVSVGQEFTDNIASVFNAQTAFVDMGSSEAESAINNWVNSSSNGLIKKFVEYKETEGRLMSLICTSYFKGNWTKKFNKEDTKLGDFLNSNGKKSRVMMMRKNEDVKYISVNDLHIVSIPFGNGSFSMFVLLPDDVSTGSAIEPLGKTSWNEIVKGMTTRTFNIQLPRFGITWANDMTDIASSLGYGDLFNGDNLSPISPDLKYASISMKQQTVFQVDEEGATVASASAVNGDIMSVSGMNFIVDRPFAFIIQENSSGTILFAGKVNKL